MQFYFPVWVLARATDWLDCLYNLGCPFEVLEDNFERKPCMVCGLFLKHFNYDLFGCPCLEIGNGETIDHLAELINGNAD